MARISYLFYVCTVVFLAACAQNVTFYDAIESEQNQRVEDANVVRVYIDAFGSIYPDNAGVNKIQSGLVESNGLYDEFSCSRAACDSIDGLMQKNIKLLCDASKDAVATCKPNDNPLVDSWVVAQTLLWQQKADAIFKKASEDNRDLFFLIHGFNNTYSQAEDSFSLIKGKVEALHEGKKLPLFVEVYWDGFKGVPLSGAWSSAQASGPLVGFQLRQLFKSIQESYAESSEPLPELMVVTHSSGAFVAGSIFGNPYSALPKLYKEKEGVSPEYDLFRKARSGDDETYPIPSFNKTRIGMIAAATPSNTFTGNEARDKGIRGGLLSENTTLIFTINPKDFGLQKFFGLRNINATGATGAGSDGDLFCTNLEEVNGHKNVGFDFSDGGFLLWNNHGPSAYLGRINSDNFLKEVLGYGGENNYPCDD